MTKTRITRSILFPIAALLAMAVAAPAAPQPAESSSLAAARRQYDRAEKMEKSLQKKLGGTRTEADYLKVVKAFRHAADLTSSPDVIAPAIIEIGRLYEQMGHLFDRKYFEGAVNAYQYLLHQYPRTRYGPEAVYAIARIEQGPLENPALAREYLKTLIAKYPSSDQADQARLELMQNPPSPDTAEQDSSSTGDVGPGLKPAPATTATDASDAAADEATLQPVSVSLSGGSEGTHRARVGSVVSEETHAATRIVVPLSGSVKFSSSFLPRRSRVFFDLSRAYLIHPHGTTLDLRSRFVSKLRVAQNEPRVVRLVLDVAPGAGYSASLLRNPYRLLIVVGKAGAVVPGIASASDSSAATSAMPAKGNLTPALPLRDSSTTSLTRALGLKIYRIVIDPGHGGFDTGTIGPNGLEEKIVCLDIARRLGRLIEQRLPGTQVIYTRDSDVFVPLEERTKIANDRKADLFISIHANSSRDPDARGIEAYYLNFTTSPHAMAVAARENALAQEAVHKLQSLLQKISLNDKIDESREFATDVDHSLVQELRLAHVVTHDRGVKKAPFVVLIGAHMPSILTEVSFLSNPTDDRLLGHPNYQQRIALGIFNGIRRYIASLNSLASTPARDEASNSRR
ncbi:MAG: N-acetylmuramoyl-L-alanine amidase [Acidobacteriota bacterium]|nr:N-acetylmuramoyl-L-alanine amidase [Acidobacteriota bacterium]